VLFNIANAFVGQEASFALQDYIKRYEKTISVKDILNKGMGKETKDLSINEQTAIVEKFEAAKVFEKKLTKKQISNVADWIRVLPSEVAMKLWVQVGNGELSNITSLHKDGDLKKYLLKIVRGDEGSKKKDAE
jgi:hypothetical protein